MKLRLPLVLLAASPAHDWNETAARSPSNHLSTERTITFSVQEPNASGSRAPSANVDSSRGLAGLRRL